MKTKPEIVKSKTVISRQEVKSIYIKKDRWTINEIEQNNNKTRDYEVEKDNLTTGSEINTYTERQMDKLKENLSKSNGTNHGEIEINEIEQNDNKTRDYEVENDNLMTGSEINTYKERQMDKLKENLSKSNGANHW
ncbi:hypothetical protein SNE40_023745 [Patella caerulea]|uniref:Uncharacterized protein n=1 Tax=Patella caerulea TaxID=87958 RepID=A0AAN8FVW4_PATCE